MRNKNTQPTGRGWLCVYTYEIVRTDVREPGSSNQGLSFIILIVSIAPIQADRAAGLETCRPVIRTGYSERDLLTLALLVDDPRAAGQGQQGAVWLQGDSHISGTDRLNRLLGRSGVAASGVITDSGSFGKLIGNDHLFHAVIIRNSFSITDRGCLTMIL